MRELSKGASGLQKKTRTVNFEDLRSIRSEYLIRVALFLLFVSLPLLIVLLLLFYKVVVLSASRTVCDSPYRTLDRARLTPEVAIVPT